MTLIILVVRIMSTSIAPILARYGAAFERLRWVPLGSGGGFSGADLWRGEDAGAPLFALKLWPEAMTAARLEAIHEWMAKASHLTFVPEVVRTPRPPIVEGRVWDLTCWMPGIADFHANPSDLRLVNACEALAQLHRAWRPTSPKFAPCPAIERRLRILADWKQNRERIAQSFTGSPSLARPANETLRRGAEAVARLVEPAERVLSQCLARPVAVQPCLCDLWHDHVLFTGDAVTGIVDYGAMKEDHAAVDLARLLGDLVGEDDAKFELGLNAYRAASAASDVASSFVRLLDRTGIACATIVWLLRFLGNSRTIFKTRAVLDRVARLVARLEAIRVF